MRQVAQFDTRIKIFYLVMLTLEFLCALPFLQLTQCLFIAFLLPQIYFLIHWNKYVLIINILSSIIYHGIALVKSDDFTHNQVIPL